jgi:hypothetical protein
MKMMVAEKTGMKTDYHFAVEAQEKAKKKQNAQAEERRLALEAKARQYDADQKSREAREAELAELRETAQKMRAIPLEEVLEHFGANRSSKDKNTFETSVGRITIDKTKFLNHTLNKRGGGAIDLTMHMEDCDYQAAVARLARAFGLEQMAGDLAATAKLQVEQALEQQPEGVYRQPDAVPERWPQVREYLSKARSLSDDLVDMLHKQKLLFADKFSNACFVLGFNRERGTGNGVELHGTLGETPFHGVKGEKRTFILRQTSENEETRIALVESAIDAMSLRQLGFGGRILSLSGNTSLESYVSAAKERGIHLLAAFHANKAGDKLAAELKRLCPPGQVERLRPIKGRDWNEELKKTEVSSPAKPFDLASRLQHELKRQEKVRERGLGRD